MLIEKPIPSKSHIISNVLGIEIFLLFFGVILSSALYFEKTLFYISLIFFYPVFIIAYKIIFKAGLYPYRIEIADGLIRVDYKSLKRKLSVECYINDCEVSLNPVANIQTNIEDIYLVIKIQNKTFEFKRLASWKHSEQKMIYEMICKKQFHEYTDDDLHWLTWMDKMIAIFES